MGKKTIFFCFIFICLICSGWAYADNYQINLEGIRGNVLTNAKTRIDIEKTSLGENPTFETLQLFSQKLPAIIKLALEPYGYFDPQIKLALLRKGNTTVITVSIKPGTPIVLARIQIQVLGPGKNNQAFQAYLRHLPLQKGNVFNVDDYEKVKENLFKIANSQGYIKASFDENKLYIDRVKHSATIDWRFQTGEQYFFGQVTIDSGPFSENFVRRFIAINSSMPFSSEKLVSLQQAMVNTYYFDQVTITPKLQEANHQKVPIDVSVIAPKAQKYSLGLGYGTFTGVRLTAGLSLRRLGNRGQHLSSQLKLSQVTSGLAIKYYIPGQNPLTDQWVIGGNYQKFNPKNGSSNSATLSAGYSRTITRWQWNGNMNYLVDRYRIFDADTGMLTDDHFSKLFYPNMNVIYTDADDLIYPTYGRYFMLNLQGASRDILSSLSFLQAETKAKVLFSPTTYSKLILRGDLGYTMTNDIKQLPLSMRFFAGGLNSVRGYFDSSLGPGRYLAIGSIEFQHRIYGNWDGAVFYDVGNAMNHWGDRLMRGEGVGIIYRSVIGPIKLYLGRAMNKTDKPHSFEFSIGPEM